MSDKTHVAVQDEDTGTCGMHHGAVGLGARAAQRNPGSARTTLSETIATDLTEPERRPPLLTPGADPGEVCPGRPTWRRVWYTTIENSSPILALFRPAALWPVSRLKWFVPCIRVCE